MILNREDFDSATQLAEGALAEFPTPYYERGNLSPNERLEEAAKYGDGRMVME